MSKIQAKRLQLRNAFLFAGGLLLATGMAVGQTSTTSVTATTPAGLFPKLETSPGFMFMHTSPTFGFSHGGNCAGGGGTIAYNFSSMLGFAADLGFCKSLGLNGATGPSSLINGTEFTYMFGPRITFRRGKFQPFGELNFGAARVKVSCNNGNLGNACGGLIPSQLPSGTTVIVVANPTATDVSKSAFALTVGGGFQFAVNHKLSIRPVQAEYLYTRFGNQCAFAVCSNNNNQNSFRLKSGIVLNWGQGGSH
jgi:opacity protein-like surface antigen